MVSVPDIPTPEQKSAIQQWKDQNISTVEGNLTSMCVHDWPSRFPVEPTIEPWEDPDTGIFIKGFCNSATAISALAAGIATALLALTF